MTLDVGHGIRTGAEIAVDFLVAAGVRHVFGIVGIHNMVPIQGVVPAPGRGATTEGR